MKKYILTSLMILASVGCFAKIPDMKNLSHNAGNTDDNQKYYMHKSQDVFRLYKTGDSDGTYFSAYDPITECTFILDGLTKCYIKDKSGKYHQNTNYYFQERDIYEGHYYKFEDDGKTHRFIVYYHLEDGTLEGALQTYE